MAKKKDPTYYRSLMPNENAITTQFNKLLAQTLDKLTAQKKPLQVVYLNRNYTPYLVKQMNEFLAQSYPEAHPVCLVPPAAKSGSNMLVASHILQAYCRQLNEAP